MRPVPQTSEQVKQAVTTATGEHPQIGIRRRAWLWAHSPGAKVTPSNQVRRLYAESEVRSVGQGGGKQRFGYKRI